MSLKTKLLELFKYEPDKDGAQTFNIKSALNDNWDRIEAWAQSVKTALAGLVPTSRTVNGKALSADVTLTAADIKMPDSEEDVGAAMAKQKMVTSIIEDGGHRILFADGAGNVAAWCDGDTAANATLQATIGKVTLSLHCVITPTGDYGLALNRTMDGVNWNKLADVALCVAPEVHELPLASGFPVQSYANTYYKTQEGIVHLNFCIFRGASTAFVEPETICTMPEGYRPSSVIAAAVGGDGKSFGNGLPSAELHIEPDGRMWFYGADTRINWVYGEITYLAG